MSAPRNDRLRLEWRPFHFRLPHALITAHGALVERRGWLLRLSQDDGAIGWGEAAPWPVVPERLESKLAKPPALHWSQSQLEALAVTITDLGPGRGRQELEAELAALPACLGFALGLALAELDGLGASPLADQARQAGQEGGGMSGVGEARGSGAVAAGTGVAANGDAHQRERGLAGAGPGSPSPGDPPGPISPWVGPWRSAPPSAWLLPAGTGALAALATLLEKAEQDGQTTDPTALGPLGRPGALRPKTLTFKWKVAAGSDSEERAVLEQLLGRLPAGSRLRLDANGGWDRTTARAWAERLAAEPRLDWMEQPLTPGDQAGLEALAALVPVALDESLRLDPSLRGRWPGWQVRRPSLEGDPRPLLRALTSGTPGLMLSTAFETGIGRRFLGHLAALQQDGPTPTAPGLAPGWRPAGALFAHDPALVWAAAGGR